MEPSKIGKYLRDVIRGEVLTDEVSRILYSTAACIYEIKPLAVVRPKDEDDVSRLVKFCRENRIPLTARGGASSLSGQTVGSGIIVDFLRFMNRIVEIDQEKRTATVEPGIIYDELNRNLRTRGLMVGPDPSSGAFCTIGGMVANNSAGPHTLRYGTTKDIVEDVEIILSDGEAARIDSSGFHGPREAASRIASLADILRQNGELISRYAPEVNKNSSGYNLFDAPSSNQGGDLRRLLCGSEGTLALTAAVTLSLVEIPKARKAALVYFRSLETAGDAIGEILELRPAALEIMDYYCLDLIRQNRPDLKHLIPHEKAVALLVEFEGETGEEVSEQMEALRKTYSRFRDGDPLMKTAEGARELQALWKVRKAAFAILNRLEGASKPINFVDDCAVNPARLPEYLKRVYAIFKAHDVEAVSFGHAGNGNPHITPLLDLKDPGEIEKMEAIAEEVTEVVRELKGSLTGEHGDGYLRTPFLPLLFGPLTEVFSQVKDIFDPDRILNPGKIVPDSDEPGHVGHDLRYGENYRRRKTNTRLDRPLLADEIEKCHGCGTCRSYCPVAIELPLEETTSRAKANVLRAVISGRLPAEALETEGVRKVLDYCFNCQLCPVECPTGIDIPLAVQIAKSEYVKHRGMRLRDRLLSETDLASRLASGTHALANAALANRSVRLLADRVIAIHKERRLPKYHTLKETRRMKSRRIEHDSRTKVAYFPGCFALYNDPVDEAEAVLDVLDKLGISVVVVDEGCCGVAKATMGGYEKLKRQAEKLAAALCGYISQGYAIVTASASCGLMFKKEYPLLFPSEKTEELSRNSYDFLEFLAEYIDSHGEGITFKPIRKRVVYHTPCHLKAQGLTTGPEQLLSRIPELELVEIEDSCCGIGGTFGIKKENYDLSMKIGERLFRAIREAGPDLVLTSCGTCKMQMEQGLKREVIHAARLLAESLA